MATLWSIFWKSVRSYLGWLFFTLIFMVVASLTGGFEAHIPLTSFIYGSIALLVIMLILGLAMGVWKD